MSVFLENTNYLTKWSDYHINYYEGYKNPTFNFHMHDYYEVNIILSGHVKIHLSDIAQDGTNCRIVLTKPKTPHYVTIDENVLYKRYNLLFSEKFIFDYLPEWKHLAVIFGQNGNIVSISPEQAQNCIEFINIIQKDTNRYRQRLLIYCFLSLIFEFSKCDETSYDKIPPYILNALSYINEHYNEKITASALAWELGISRTTLMTSFKKYTNVTLNHHICQCRLKRAARFLKEGKSLSEASELCGFGGSYGIIRAFKRFYGMTPRQYIEKN